MIGRSQPSRKGRSFTYQLGFRRYSKPTLGVYLDWNHAPVPLISVLGSNFPSASTGRTKRFCGAAIALAKGAYGNASLKTTVRASGVASETTGASGLTELASSALARPMATSLSQENLTSE